MTRHFARTALAAAVSLLAPSLAQGKTKVVSTTQDPAALARAVGGDRVVVTALSKGDQDPHYLDAKPSYIQEINRADLVLAIGLDLEIGYLPALLTQARNPRVLPGERGYLDLSSTITPREVKASADRSEGDIHPNGNPHYWLSPENARRMARAIAARLTELDRDGAAAYSANLAAFETELDARVPVWKARLAPLAGKPIVTFHASWTYFAEAFDLKVVGFIEPKPGIPPTARHTVQVIKLMQAQGARVVLMENFYDSRAAELVTAKVEGATVVKVPNSVGGEEGVKTWFDLMDRITSALAAAAP